MAPSRKVQARLKKDLVIWLTTVGADSRPHAVLVWFWWDGETFLVYSLPGQKVNDMRSHPHVELHLNSDPEGAEMVRVSGTAEFDPSQPPAFKVAGYVRKYREQMKGFGWTPAQFSDQYRVAVRILPTRFH